ncbi:MAG TPA: ornithine carbamoyltransferase [Burkholderiales bacterium]|nr:ornithine carbamoyltransferase [Burkholderiales bacterium]
MSSQRIATTSPMPHLAPGVWLDDLISIRDLSSADARTILDLADVMKARPKDFRTSLAGKQLAMFFEKPSLRTRLTFESGMASLGGTAFFVDNTRDRLDAREKLSDIAHNLERWVDCVVLRTFEHSTIQQMAEHAAIPVINALSDLEHPCQALADFLTLRQKFGDVSDVHLAFVGDGNNVAHSLMLTAALLGGVFTIATPPGYEPNGEIVTIAKAAAAGTGACINITHDPIAAVSKADAIYTDVWASMGKEAEAAERRTVFAPYQVNDELMSCAANHAAFMHCLPAHRGDEVTDSVIDSSRSVVFDQAENRLHVQKAILFLLLSDSRHHLVSGRANA